MIRTPGEKKNYKYLRIFEADTIKQVETKEKNNKIVPKMNEKAWNQTVLIKMKTPGQSFLKDIRGNSWYG